MYSPQNCFKKTFGTGVKQPNVSSLPGLKHMLDINLYKFSDQYNMLFLLMCKNSSRLNKGAGVGGVDYKIYRKDYKLDTRNGKFYRKYKLCKD